MPGVGYCFQARIGHLVSAQLLMALKKSRVRKAHDGIRLSSLSPEKHQQHGQTWSQPHVVPELQAVFAYREIPDEVLAGSDLDLSIWSVVASDACLVRLARNSDGSGIRSPGRLQLQPQSNQLTDLLTTAVSAAAGAVSETGAVVKQQPITRINLAGADQITDKSAHVIAVACPELKYLNLERASRVKRSTISSASRR